MYSSRIRMVVLLALSCALEGCAGRGDDSEVSGSVLLDSQPLAGAEVRFIPKDDTSLGTHAAATDSAGKFILKGDRNIPVKPGAYIVIVQKIAVQESAAKGAPPGKGMIINTVPFIYQNRDRTPLKADIQAGANKLPPFELKSSPKR